MSASFNIVHTNRSDEHLTNEFKDLVEQKILSVTKLDKGLFSVRVVYQVSNNASRGGDSHTIEITAESDTALYNAGASAPDFETAIDEAKDKFRRQLRKEKEARTVSKSGHRTPESVADTVFV